MAENLAPVGMRSTVDLSEFDGPRIASPAAGLSRRRGAAARIHALVRHGRPIRPGAILEGSMTLRLVSSSDGPALAIRDHLLPLVRERGTLEVQRGAVRLIALRTDGWMLEHWTPFNDLSPGEASSPGYRHALQQQHTTPDLPYGLGVWRGGAKVLSVLWADSGAFEVVGFVRGGWEAEALAL
jgi:hypothetical protein